ncbi:effector-associated constant component EACC1 [Nocardia wallacei]|uniref:effector-associated constant component EACC1 n=1 Tax=Nocardia wallacei TaxID=480035 RepID=UPI002455B015|nr:hypothetical protein [Nocardia wallacei]
MSDDGWRITVIPEGGALRQERLTRDLRRQLQSTEGIDAGFVESTRPTPDGSKGVSDPDLVLWAGVGVASVNAAARVLIAAITQWCEQNKHRTVQLERNGSKVMVSGHLGKRQARLVERFIREIDEPGADNSEGGAE